MKWNNMVRMSTFSIVAYDPGRQEWGAAVQSKFLAVGAVVPWARAGAGVVAMPAYPRTSQKTIHLLVFALLATMPDWPFKNWGHDTDYFSHSIFTNLILIAQEWVILFFIPRLWKKYSHNLEILYISWQLMLWGSVAWISHLLLDTFYNHGKRLMMFWPVSGARLALPVPWLAVASRPFLPVSARNVRIFLLEFITFSPLVILLSAFIPLTHCFLGRSAEQLCWNNILRQPGVLDSEQKSPAAISE